MRGDGLDSELLVTLDLDWAPDFAIDAAVELLQRHRVKATWFVTHTSPAVERLRAASELFELGIHPNFLPGSTHGATPEAVLAHCMGLVPEARAFRAHGLVQSTGLLDAVLRCTPLQIDATPFAPRTPGLRPFEYHWGGRSLWRVPCCFEDDCEWERPDPCFRLEPLLGVGAGLKVMSFHPIHVFLNSSDAVPYRRLKRSVARLTMLGRDQAEAEVQPGPGAGTLFVEALAHLGATGGGQRLSDLVAEARAQRAAGGPYRCG
jgi:hypothetical protein